MSLQRHSNFSVSGFRVPIRNTADYSPFGVQLDGRTISGDSYRYGYQGSEKDDESKGGGNSYTTQFRMLDPRIGRWFSVDPVFQPWQSPYCSMDNNPILFNDILGDHIDPERTKGKNFMVVADKATRKADAKSHGGFFKSAYSVDFVKAKMMKVLSFGKLNIIEASSTADAVQQIKDVCGKDGYVKNMTVDFHSRFFGSDQYADYTGGTTQGMTNMTKSLGELSEGFSGSATTCYFANCWSGGNADLTDGRVTHTERKDITSIASSALDGATVYGPQFATSTLKFLFTNQFNGKFKEYFSTDPGNLKHLGLHTKSVLTVSTTIDVVVRIRNSGKIKITQKKAKANK